MSFQNSNTPSVKGAVPIQCHSSVESGVRRKRWTASSSALMAAEPAWLGSRMEHQGEHQCGARACFVGQPILAAAGFQPALFTRAPVGFRPPETFPKGPSLARVNACQDDSPHRPEEGK